MPHPVGSRYLPNYGKISERSMKKSFNPASVRRHFGNYNRGLLVPPGAALLVTSGQLG
ncbi:RidA family protein, partial [Rhizobium ruizarguesonis]